MLVLQARISDTTSRNSLEGSSGNLRAKDAMRARTKSMDTTRCAASFFRVSIS